MPITITERGISANPLTHTYEVVADIQGKAAGLKAGMVAKVQITNHQSQITNNDIVIPANCVLLKPEGPTVWVAEKTESRARRSITIDGYQADGVRVKTGLQAGDTLITEGYQKLYKGCAV